MLNIVLVNPAIPGNTATTGRTCLATNSTLHLVKPLGFDIDEKAVRRAGLDYWSDVDIKLWESLDEFLKANPITDRHFFATTKSDKNYFEIEYQKGDFIYFGKEDAGLPMELMEKKWENAITIPMHNTRSLNLAVSVGIVAYEAIKQNVEIF